MFFLRNRIAGAVLLVFLAAWGLRALGRLPVSSIPIPDIDYMGAFKTVRWIALAFLVPLGAIIVLSRKD